MGKTAMQSKPSGEEGDDPPSLLRVKSFLRRLGMDSRLPQRFEEDHSNVDLIKSILRVGRVEPGRISCVFTVDPQICNLYNTLHGGAVASIAELLASACAETVAAGKDFVLCELSISYPSALKIHGRILTGTMLGVVIAGGSYASTTDEATFSGCLFNATKLVNPFFALLEPEVAHRLAISAAARGFIPREKRPDPQILEVEVWGQKFSNPIGLAAGYDKNAEAVENLLGLGFSFVEVGSITPIPQEGNPKPCIFRIPQEGAIISRDCFNSEGLVAVVERLAGQYGKIKFKRKTDEMENGGETRLGIVGVNVGKNKSSEDASADYLQGFHTLCHVADYLVINVSSPNTPGLRKLQGRKQLKNLIKKVQSAHDEMLWGEKGPPPLLVKVAPDLSRQDLEDIAAVC